MRQAMRCTVVGLALALAAGQATARPVVPAEKRYWQYSGEIPACDSPDVLSRITDRFQATESEYWDSKLEIVAFDAVKVVGLRTWGLDHIPRNFCIARAKLNDNSVHQVAYNVSENLSIIGSGFGVEYCLVGLDREFAYAPDCKMALP